jgi:hypothetical protein
MSRYPLLDTGLTQALGQGFGLGLQRRRLDEDARQRALENERRAILDAFLMELQRERLSLDQRELGERERINAATLDLRRRESARQDEELRIRLADEARRAADAVRSQREREANNAVLLWEAERLGGFADDDARAAFNAASPEGKRAVLQRMAREAATRRVGALIRGLSAQLEQGKITPRAAMSMIEKIADDSGVDLAEVPEFVEIAAAANAGMSTEDYLDLNSGVPERVARAQSRYFDRTGRHITPPRQQTARATTLANDRTYQRLIRKVKQKQSAYERAERAYWQVFEEHGGDAFAENEPAVQAARRRLEQAERELDAAEEAEAMYEPGGEQQRPGPALVAPSAAAASSPPQAGPVAAVEPDDADLDAAFDLLGPDATDEEVWNLAVRIRSQR